MATDTVKGLQSPADKYKEVSSRIAETWLLVLQLNPKGSAHSRPSINTLLSERRNALQECLVPVS